MAGSRPRKLHNFTDRNLDLQIKELVDSHVLYDIAGSGRKWIILGVQILNDGGVEFPQLVIQEI